MLKLEMIIILVILDLRQIRLPMDAKLDFVFLFRTFCDKDNSFVGYAKKEADMYSIHRNIRRNDLFNF